MTENLTLSEDVLQDIRRALVDEQRTPEGREMLRMAYAQKNVALIHHLLWRNTLPSREELETKFFCNFVQEIGDIVGVSDTDNTSA